MVTDTLAEPTGAAMRRLVPVLAGAVRVRLAGPLTAATAPALRAQVRAALARSVARVMVDLQGVTGLDAAGIAALLEARRVMTQAGGTLVLRTNEVVCRALKDTGTIAAFALWNRPGM